MIQADIACAYHPHQKKIVDRLIFSALILNYLKIDVR